MRKTILFLSLLLVCLGSTAQPVEYYLNNTLRFVDGNNDTVPFPFVGGFISPQFNEIDLNNDHIKDLVVFDRSSNKIMTFLNKGYAGQVYYIYAPQYEYFFPPVENWMLLRDYNCDGKEDIFWGGAGVVGLYKNTSSGSNLQFTHITNQVPDTAGDFIYVYVDDIPVFDDIDGDGDLDMMSFSVGGGVINYYMNRRVEKNLPCDSLAFKLVDFCWGSFAEGQKSDTVFLANQANCVGGKFYGKRALHAGSTLLTFDNDEDGDMDLALGDVDQPRVKLMKNGKTEHGMRWDTVISYTLNFPSNSLPVNVPQFPATFYLDVNNDGKKDLLASSNDPLNGSNVYQNWWYQNNGKNNKPLFQFRDSSFLQEMTVDFGSLTTPALFDADGDGDLDLVVSHRGNYIHTHNMKDRLALYENVGTLSRAVFALKDENYLNLAADNLSGVYPTFPDLTGDGLPDMVLGLHNGKMRFYTNTGTSTNPVFTLTKDTLVGIDVGIMAAPHFYDINGDSALDLILGDLSGTFSYFPNWGTRTNPIFADTCEADTLWRIRVNSFHYNYGDFDSLGNPIDSTKNLRQEGHSNGWIADIDMDGKPEMVCGSRSGVIFIYTLDLNNLADSLPQWDDYFVLPHTGAKSTADLGEQTSVAMMDADGDGRLDMIIGNKRGGLHYLNSRYTPLDTMAVSTNAPAPVMALSMYPNPTNEQVTLRADAYLEGELQVTLLDIFGRELGEWRWEPTSRREILLDVSGPSAGTYFVRVSHPGYRQQVLRLSIVR